jgi:hypothetical protein
LPDFVKLASQVAWYDFLACVSGLKLDYQYRPIRLYNYLVGKIIQQKALPSSSLMGTNDDDIVLAFTRFI